MKKLKSSFCEHFSFSAAPSANAPVIIQNGFQMEKKSNTTSIVIINVVCWCVVAPIVVFIAMVARAASEIVSNLPEATTQVKDICELDGQTFNLTENIILTLIACKPAIVKLLTFL